MSADRDVDNDSAMHSSPSISAHEDDDDSMFPDEALDAIPPSTPYQSRGNHPDFSPPDSQNARRTASHELNENGKRVLSASAAAVAGPGGTVGNDGVPGGAETDAANREEPGWKWKNRKALEEQARALDQIIDQHLMIKGKYGDPLDDSIKPSA